MIDKRMSIIYTLEVRYTILRASGGIHHKNDRTVGSSKISHECTVCFQCVPLSSFLTM